MTPRLWRNTFRAMPEVRHGESVLWRISMRTRLLARPQYTLARELPPPRSSEAAAAAALRTHDDVCSALPAAGYTDRVFEALHAVSGAEGSLDRRLTDVRRKNLSCCRRTIHIESRPVQSCLNCHPLLALDHLLLCLASRRRKYTH